MADGFLTTTCPWCESRNDGYTELRGGRPPSPEAVTICLYCANFSFFDESLQLRKPTSDELIAIAFDPELLHYQRLAQEHVIQRREDDDA